MVYYYATFAFPARHWPCLALIDAWTTHCHACSFPSPDSTRPNPPFTSLALALSHPQCMVNYSPLPACPQESRSRLDSVEQFERLASNRRHSTNSYHRNWISSICLSVNQSVIAALSAINSLNSLSPCQCHYHLTSACHRPEHVAHG